VSTWKAILATLVIYCAGILTGGLVMKSIPGGNTREVPSPFQGPDFVQQRFLERMKKDLELTPDQTRRIENVLRESRERMKTWWEIIGPEMRTELKETQEKVRAELNPGQREKFEKLLKERRRPPGGPPGGERRPRDHRSNAPRGSLQFTNPASLPPSPLANPSTPPARR
jgi:hypothetical protein